MQKAIIFEIYNFYNEQWLHEKNVIHQLRAGHAIDVEPVKPLPY